MIKDSVQVTGIRPEMVMCDNVIQLVFYRLGIECVRTSITGKKHGTRSLHPVGFAVDYRTKHIIGRRRLVAIENLVQSIKVALPCCDVVFEHEGEAQEHIHVEFDPKDDSRFQKAKEHYVNTGRWPEKH